MLRHVCRVSCREHHPVCLCGWLVTASSNADNRQCERPVAGIASSDSRRISRHAPADGDRMTMLKRLLPSQDIDSLLGDIAEEAPRRSRRWYWSQLLAVVVVASWRDARRHPWLALRAIATGFAALTLYFGTVQLIGRFIRVLSNGGYYIAGYWLTLPSRPLPP